MKIETDKQITRHSLTTRMCLNFCYLPQKKFAIQPTHIAHIAKAPRASAPTEALPKSAILSTQLGTVISKLTIFSI